MIGLPQIFKNKQWADFSSQSCIYVLRIVMAIFVGAYVARYLGASNLGIISLMTALVAMTNPFIDLGTKQILVKKVAQQDINLPIDFWGVLRIKLIVSIIVSTVLATILLTGVSESLSSAGAGVILLGCGVILVIPWNQFEVLITANLKNKELLRGQILALIIMAAYKIWLVQSEKSINWFMMAYLLDALLNISNLLFVSSNHKLIPHFVRGGLISGLAILKTSWLLMLSGVAVIMYMKSDLVMIDYFLESRHVGYYTIASNLIGIAYFLPVALSGSLTKSVYQKLSNADDAEKLLQSLFTVFTAVGCALAGVVMIVSPVAVPLIYSREYSMSALILVILALGVPAVSLGMSRSLYLIHHGMHKFILGASLSGLIVNLALNALMIPLYGVIGAAIASVISYYVSAILSSLFIRESFVFRSQIKSFIPSYKNLVRSLHEVK